MNSARARVKVTLEIDVPDRWGDDCDMAQIKKEASESAIAKLHEKACIGTILNILRTEVTAVLVCEETE